MQDVRIDRLCLDRGAHILQGMEKSLYEIEREAHRMRSREFGRVMRAGARGVARGAVSLFKSALNLFSAKVVRHA